MTDQAVQRPKTEIEDKIIDFVAKRSGVKERYDDYFVTIYANSLLGQRIYCVDWAFEDEQPYYTSYVGAKLDDHEVLEYYDDERALIQSLSLLSSEEDKNYRATKFKQITDISLDAIAGVIAVAITALIAYCVVFIPGKDISQLWNIFAVIIGYYFGKNISRNSASTASR